MLRLLNDPIITLLAKRAGLDFAMLDFEHGPYGFDDLAAMAATGHAAGLRVFIRVPELARGYVSRALDCGADGVMVPMIESVEQARSLAAWAKYDPIGRRGLSSIGAHSDYAQPAHARPAMAQANEQTLAIAQIETAAGVEVVDQIAALEGIDALVVGPNDLAVSLGCAGELSAPPVSAGIERIARAARAHGKIFGMHAGVEFLSRWTAFDMRLIINSLDIELLSKGLAALAGEARTLAHPAELHR